MTGCDYRSKSRLNESFLRMKVKLNIDWPVLLF